MGELLKNTLKCEEKLEEINQILFKINQITGEMEIDEEINLLSKNIAELSNLRKKLSDDYFKVENYEEKIEPKAFIKFISDVLSDLLKIIRYYDGDLSIIDLLLSTSDLIDRKEELINNHYINLAKSELELFKNEKFKHLLSGIIDFKHFQQEESEEKKSEEKKF